jgi:hypothetical protein
MQMGPPTAFAKIRGRAVRIAAISLISELLFDADPPRYLGYLLLAFFAERTSIGCTMAISEVLRDVRTIRRSRKHDVVAAKGGA